MHWCEISTGECLVSYVCSSTQRCLGYENEDIDMMHVVGALGMNIFGAIKAVVWILTIPITIHYHYPQLLIYIWLRATDITMGIVICSSLEVSLLRHSYT